MKITGSSNYIKFDLENGYVVKASGEMLIDRTFLVYKDSMKFWDEPHDKEEISQNQIKKIIAEVERMSNENTVKLIFE